MSKLITYYDAAVERGALIDSENQREVLGKLQVIADTIEQAHVKKHWWSRQDKHIQGLYVHGPVGAGKTYLMDIFYEHVHEAHKKRYHFHHFMQHVDEGLRRYHRYQNPLKHIAAKLAHKAHVLCLDEFLVEDVADASILAELLQTLFSHGMILVATANTTPDNLYLDGLHRERFLPAIALLKQHCDVMCLDDHRDYRVGREVMPEAYFFPANAKHEARMLELFRTEEGVSDEKGEFDVQHRMIPYVRRVTRAIWFEFDVICNLPRSQLDYLEIATRFDAVYVSGIPAMGVNDPAQMVLFIRFVDVMYDEGIRLILLATVPLEMIYVKGPMEVMFQRTLSRLQEMQSPDYWVHGRRNMAKF